MKVARHVEMTDIGTETPTLTRAPSAREYRANKVWYNCHQLLARTHPKSTKRLGWPDDSGGIAQADNFEIDCLRKASLVYINETERGSRSAALQCYQYSERYEDVSKVA